MGYLDGKSVYLCGPISDALDSGVKWRDELTPKLKELGLTVNDPCKKTSFGEVGDDKAYFRGLIKDNNWDVLKEKFWPVIRSDLRMSDKSDFLIWFYPPKVPTIGSLHETILAHLMRKPILVYTPQDQLEFMNPWAFCYIKKNCLFSDLSKMIDYLKVVDSGKFDSSYWTV